MYSANDEHYKDTTYIMRERSNAQLLLETPDVKTPWYCPSHPNFGRVCFRYVMAQACSKDGSGILLSSSWARTTSRRVWAGRGWWWDLTTLPWVQKELEERARRPPLHHPSHPRCCVWGGWHGHGRGCARGRFRVPAGWHGHGRRRVCGEVCRWYFPLVAYEVVLKRVTLIRHTRNSCRSFEFIKRHTQIMRSDTPGTVCCF